MRLPCPYYDKAGEHPTGKQGIRTGEKVCFLVGVVVAGGVVPAVGVCCIVISSRVTAGAGVSSGADGTGVGTVIDRVFFTSVPETVFASASFS